MMYLFIFKDKLTKCPKNCENYNGVKLKINNADFKKFNLSESNFFKAHRLDKILPTWVLPEHILPTKPIFIINILLL